MIRHEFLSCLLYNNRKDRMSVEEFFLLKSSFGAIISISLCCSSFAATNLGGDGGDCDGAIV